MIQRHTFLSFLLLASIPSPLTAKQRLAKPTVNLHPKKTSKRFRKNKTLNHKANLKKGSSHKSIYIICGLSIIIGGSTFMYVSSQHRNHDPYHDPTQNNNNVLSDNDIQSFTNPINTPSIFDQNQATSDSDTQSFTNFLDTNFIHQATLDNNTDPTKIQYDKDAINKDNTQIVFEKFENNAYTTKYDKNTDTYTLSFTTEIGDTKEDVSISYRLQDNAHAINLVPKSEIEGNQEDKHIFSFKKDEYIKAQKEILEKLTPKDKKKEPPLDEYFNTIFDKIDDAASGDAHKLATMQSYIVRIKNTLPEVPTLADKKLIQDSLITNYFEYNDTTTTHCADGLVKVAEELVALFSKSAMNTMAIEEYINDIKLKWLEYIVLKRNNFYNYETVGITQAIINAPDLDDFRKKVGLHGLPKTVAYSSGCYGWRDKIVDNQQAILHEYQQTFTLARLVDVLSRKLYCPRGKHYAEVIDDIEASTKFKYIKIENNEKVNHNPITKINNTYAWFNKGISSEIGDANPDIEITEYVSKGQKRNVSIFKRGKQYSLLVYLTLLGGTGIVQVTQKQNANGTANFNKLDNQIAIDQLHKVLQKKV